VKCDDEHDEHACFPELGDCQECASATPSCQGTITKYSDGQCTLVLNPGFDACLRHYDDAFVSDCDPPGTMCL
jgi:hypothetical protein